MTRKSPAGAEADAIRAIVTASVLLDEPPPNEPAKTCRHNWTEYGIVLGVGVRLGDEEGYAHVTACRRCGLLGRWAE